MRFIKTFFIFYFADLQRFTTTLKNKVCNSFLFCHSFSTSLAIQLSIKPIKRMNKPNLTESQKTLLKEAFQGITDHCTDTDNPNNESHRKELNRLINYHIRFGETLERAVGDSYWSVMEAIDIENQLALEA